MRLYLLVPSIALVITRSESGSVTNPLPDDTQCSVKFCDQYDLGGHCDWVNFNIRGCYAIPNTDQGVPKLSWIVSFTLLKSSL